MKRVLTERRLCELAGICEGDTEEMPPVANPNVTHELTPVEFAQELAKQIDLEQFSEKEVLAGWRQWSAAALQAREANKPPPPPESVIDNEDQSITTTQDIDFDPDPTGEAHRKKWSGKKYMESERLFRHFFGDYLGDNNRPLDDLGAIMDVDDELRRIIVDLYGWQLPRQLLPRTRFGYPKQYDGPDTNILKIAQEFEAENKPIEGNEAEFLKRSDAYMTKGVRSQVRAGPNLKAGAKRAALNDVIEKHKKDPRFADLFTPLEGEEGGLPPLAHAGGHGMRVEEYAEHLIELFKDEYEDLYKKHLDAYLS